jgi:AraC-like DNA-binding protein
MFKEIVLEIPSLTQDDCFTITSGEIATYPLHYHEELELKLITGAVGTQRIIGDHTGETGDVEMVLVGSNLPHGWFVPDSAGSNHHEITVHFKKDIFPLEKNQLINIRKMFEDAKRGLLFSVETTMRLAPRLLALHKKAGFESVLEIQSILHDLSMAGNSRMLSGISFTKDDYNSNNQRIEEVFSFLQLNFSKKVRLTDVARVANMSKGAFSRFIKIHTGHSFAENLIQIRLGHVSRMLINSSYSVSEIANKCGFQNMANFNRIFRERKGCSPKIFKKRYMMSCQSL